MQTHSHQHGWAFWRDRSAEFWGGAILGVTFGLFVYAGVEIYVGAPLARLATFALGPILAGIGAMIMRRQERSDG